MNLDAPLNCEATTLVSVFVLEEKEVELSRFWFWFRIPLYVALNSSCVAKLSIFDLLAEGFCLRDPRGNCRWISEVDAETSSGCCDSYQMCIGGRWSLRTFPSFQLSPETQLLFRPIWEQDPELSDLLHLWWVEAQVRARWGTASTFRSEEGIWRSREIYLCYLCCVWGIWKRARHPCWILQRFVRNFADWGWLSAGGGETSFTLNSPSIEYWGAAAIEYWTVELAMEKNIEPMVIFCFEL